MRRNVSEDEVGVWVFVVDEFLAAHRPGLKVGDHIAVASKSGNYSEQIITGVHTPGHYRVRRAERHEYELWLPAPRPRPIVREAAQCAADADVTDVSDL